MAFSLERWNENAAGMSGFGRMAVYDGSGNDANDTPAGLGDPLGGANGIRSNNFFDHPVVRDAIREVITVQPGSSDNSISADNPERGALGESENFGAHVATLSCRQPTVHHRQEGAGVVQQVRFRRRRLDGSFPTALPSPARAEATIAHNDAVGVVQAVQIQDSFVERPPARVVGTDRGMAS